MKRFILLITIALHAAYFTDFGAFAQSNQREDIIKKPVGGINLVHT